MYRYVLKRLIWSIPTLLGAVTIIFLVMRILPGDVAQSILSDAGSRAVDPVEYNLLREELGLNRPLYVQYFSWLWDMIRLDLGTSMFFGTEVWDEGSHIAFRARSVEQDKVVINNGYLLLSDQG